MADTRHPTGKTDLRPGFQTVFLVARIYAYKTWHRATATGLSARASTEASIATHSATLACQPPNGRSENRASAVAFRPAAVYMLVSAQTDDVNEPYKGSMNHDDGAILRRA